MWDLSSPTRDWTRIPCIGRRILYHWTTREVPRQQFCGLVVDGAREPDCGRWAVSGHTCSLLPLWFHSCLLDALINPPLKFDGVLHLCLRPRAHMIFWFSGWYCKSLVQQTLGFLQLLPQLEIPGTIADMNEGPWGSETSSLPLFLPFWLSPSPATNSGHMSSVTWAIGKVKWTRGGSR